MLNLLGRRAGPKTSVSGRLRPRSTGRRLRPCRKAPDVAAPAGRASFGQVAVKNIVCRFRGILGTGRHPDGAPDTGAAGDARRRQTTTADAARPTGATLGSGTEHEA